MLAEKPTMAGQGRSPSITAEEVFNEIEKSPRPVWSATNVAEYFGVSRPTADKRLKELHNEGRLDSLKLGNAVGYLPARPGTDRALNEEELKNSIIRHFTDSFVGLPTAPWTAVNPNDGPAVEGDKVQIRVEGTPYKWYDTMTRPIEDKRGPLLESELDGDETQALIIGELYTKPTTPIEHTSYPDNYDIEVELGVSIQHTDKGSILVASGPKNYLLQPCNEAVFLKNVEVEWISPPGNGASEDDPSAENPENGEIV